ncbi:MAG: hypothetical protein WBC91_04140 [Phototrophicaceae bacterium]
MKWTFDDYRHYSTEHMQKADKQRQARELDKDPTPQRRGVLGKRRGNSHTV